MSIDDAIVRGRAALFPLLRDTAAVTHTPLVSDGRGGWVPGVPATSSVPCNVQRTLNATEQMEADRLGVVSPAIIRVPVGTAADSSDQIVVGADTFEVVVLLTDTIQLTLKILVKEL